ncbi:MAG: OmpA family protein [Flavobacteriales bacterium]|nr:OmpA family protein [Flavobacteriales bacterium]
MTRTIALWSALLVVANLSAQQNEQLTIHFASASALISAEDRAALQALCKRPDAASIKAIELVGHTDVRGDVAFNEDLSARRAQAVAGAILATCLSAVPISIHEAGENAPLNEGTTPGDHAQNRRVEVHLELDARDVRGTAFVQRHPRVKPLMPEAETRHESFQVDPSLPIEFVASDGVRVRIAAGAIVDLRGNNVNGPVDISYRSFNDPWSIIASGIPMHVGDRDNADHMESLGMYEVYASQKGSPLSLREGEVISLTKPTSEERTAGYLDWVLDETTGEWREQIKAQETPALQVVGTGDDVSSSARFRYVQAIRRLPMLPDSTLFLDRLASTSYCHTEPCGSAAKPYVYEDGRYVSPYMDKAIPAIEVIAEKGVYRGQRVTGFRIKLRNEPSHTEWRAFPTSRIWAYNGPLNKRRFAERYARRHFYQDIALEVSADGQSGILRLKDRGTWLELPLDLTFHQGSNTDAKAFRDELIAYKARSEAKRTRFDRRLNEKLGTAKKDVARGKERAWNDARRVMNDTELAMTGSEFDVYAMSSAFAQAQNTSFADASPAGQVALNFSMRGFGIYNCDQILKREAIEPQQIAVLDSTGNYFPWVTAYGVLEGRRTVITYWGDGTGSARNMRLSTDMSSLLFVGIDGNLLLVDQPGSLLRPGKVTLKGVPQQPPQSPAELGALASKE